jgi:hypothetical protein
MSTLKRISTSWYGVSDPELDDSRSDWTKWTDGDLSLDKLYGQDKARALIIIKINQEPKDRSLQSKDVFASDRASESAEIVSGAVAAPFETLKPVRRETRKRIRRIIDDCTEPQKRKPNSED